MGLVHEGETQKVQRLCDFETRTHVKSVGTERESIGCLCQSPHSCHGHVLVDLLMKAFSPEEDYCTKASKGNIYYFKGSFCPLSNFYPAVVVNGPLKQCKLQKKFRLGSFQLYYWQKAVNTGS